MRFHYSVCISLILKYTNALQKLFSFSYKPITTTKFDLFFKFMFQSHMIYIPYFLDELKIVTIFEVNFTNKQPNNKLFGCNIIRSGRFFKNSFCLFCNQPIHVFELLFLEDFFVTKGVLLKLACFQHAFAICTTFNIFSYYVF